MPLACGGDELFLLPLTALSMEEEELRQELSVQGPLFLSPASEKTFWLSKTTPHYTLQICQLSNGSLVKFSSNCPKK